MSEVDKVSDNTDIKVKKENKKTKKSTKEVKNSSKKIKKVKTEEEKAAEKEKRRKLKEEKEAKAEKQKYLEKLQEKVDNIREDLKTQLLAQSKFGKQFDDMIEDYIFLVKLKEDLQLDIKLNGLRYQSMTGNGFAISKPNESVQNLLKVNAQMLKILQDLELKSPDEEGGEKSGDDLL